MRSPPPAESGTLLEASSGDGGVTVLVTIALVLLVLWFIGMVSTYTLGGVLHILLVIAVIFLLIGLIRGRTIA
jgi:hypothetical protein